MCVCLICLSAIILNRRGHVIRREETVILTIHNGINGFSGGLLTQFSVRKIWRQLSSNRLNHPKPETLPELASVIYNSLAKCYAEKLKEIEKLTGKKYDRIHIIGGGSNAVYLNELTAKYTGIPVHAGPGEATAIGNILTQMIQDGIFENLVQARACVAESFEIKIYE